MRSRILAALWGAATLSFAGCQGERIVATSEPVVPVRISVNVASAAAIAGVSVEISGPGITNPIVANLPIVSGVAEGTIEVLAGSARVFLVRAYDEQGVETHRGEASRDIPGGSSISVSISLTPLVSDVDLDARIGTYAITVHAPATTLGAGSSQQLSVEVVDAHGSVVPGAQVVWGSSNPAVASVSSSGLLQALVPGQTTIAANYKGFAGVATITVQ